MITLHLGDISIKTIKHSSGMFMGQKNTHRKFRSDKVINEEVGLISGDENTLMDNYWGKFNEKWEEE
ncbi:hypothetical protein [Neobacillus dielmonensis]|uniref:hypothetical protein n=1 Tax=Neobacillus dielmonensis TaxID=1347369 RepID=UPI0005A74A86|nr:hypothetical protein [Neobacillus dielmonensis]